jgi:hypothetical protein
MSSVSAGTAPRDVRQSALLLMRIYAVHAARNADSRARNLREMSPAGALHWTEVASEIRRLAPAEVPAGAA